MKIKNPLLQLSRRERVAWLASLAVITVCFFLTSNDYLTLVASLLGVTCLAFVCKGLVTGKVLTVIFSVFYGIVSFVLCYYGEMITYLCMSTPIAIASIFSWLRHPYKDSDEVEVHRMTRREICVMLLLAAAVTTAFYFILGALHTANLLVSTISVTTSFTAAYLSMMRSPFYAVAYIANDLVLIVLWIGATLASLSYFPMVVCFVIFLLYDFYGFLYWLKMQKRQEKN
jgi:nicotinamide mononucleotide transporter PnuC